MTRPLDEVLSELAAVQDELLATPADDFGRRADLTNQQDALRAEAAAARSTVRDDLSAQQIEQQIDHIRTQILRHLDARPAASAAAQTGQGGGIDPFLLHQMNQKASEAFGLDDLYAQLRKLEVRLAELRGE